MDDKDFLEHFGVPGMHWGRRKGSSNNESYNTRFLKKKISGLKSDREYFKKNGYTQDLPGVNKEIKKRTEQLKKSVTKDLGKNKPNYSEDHNKKVALKKKKVSEMSNAELKALNERLQLEKQYKDLTKADITPGQKFVTDIIVNGARQTAGNYAAKYMTTGVEAILKKTIK